jgi:hypothetical protein
MRQCRLYGELSQFRIDKAYLCSINDDNMRVGLADTPGLGSWNYLWYSYYQCRLLRRLRLQHYKEVPLPCFPFRFCNGQQPRRLRSLQSCIRREMTRVRQHAHPAQLHVHKCTLLETGTTVDCTWRMRKPWPFHRHQPDDWHYRRYRVETCSSSLTNQVLFAKMARGDGWIFVAVRHRVNERPVV